MKINNKRFYIFATLVSLVLVVIDQITKSHIAHSMRLGESYSVLEGFFNITYVRNTGAAFGMMAGSHEVLRVILFLIITVLACGWVIYLIINK